jgi:phage tail tape-measure protein
MEMTSIRKAIGVATLATVVLGLGACGEKDQRSVASFCGTMESEKGRILGQLHAGEAAASSQSDELAGGLLALGTSVQALGEIRTYFRKLSKVAPPDIESEVEIVAEQFDKSFDQAAGAAGNPLGSMAQALVGSLLTSGPLSSVDQFARQNCGEGI